MRFVLHLGALNGDDTTLSRLDRLVDRVGDQVHTVEVPDADRLQASSWYANARPTRRKLVTSAVAVPPRKRANSPGPHSKSFEVRDADGARVADKLAHTPLVLLVEDREADGLLLEILVGALGPPELRELWLRGQATTPRAIEIDTAGGINAMPQRVRRAERDAQAEGRPLRLLVLCDSDARWPTDPGPSHASIEELRSDCSQLGIPLHVLRKRNAENYIPDRVIKAARDDPRNLNHFDRFNVFLGLSASQRDHFPLKDGLSDDERAQALQNGLYQASQESDLHLLKERLFPKRPRLLVQVWKEHRAHFTEYELRARDGEGEVDSLLDTIATEL